MRLGLLQGHLHFLCCVHSQWLIQHTGRSGAGPSQWNTFRQCPAGSFQAIVCKAMLTSKVLEESRRTSQSSWCAQNLDAASDPPVALPTAWGCCNGILSCSFAASCMTLSSFRLQMSSNSSKAASETSGLFESMMQTKALWSCALSAADLDICQITVLHAHQDASGFSGIAVGGGIHSQREAMADIVHGQTWWIRETAWNHS